MRSDNIANMEDGDDDVLVSALNDYERQEEGRMSDDEDDVLIAVLDDIEQQQQQQQQHQQDHDISDDDNGRHQRGIETCICISNRQNATTKK